MVEGLPNAGAVVEAFAALGDNDEKARKKTKRQGYVLEYMGAIVGAAICKDGVDVAHLADNFELEDHVALACHAHDGHGVLEQFVLAPVFGGSVRSVLHQLMRLGAHTVLYLQESASGGVTLDYSARQCLVQVKPRPPVLLPPADWSPPEGNWVKTEEKEQPTMPDFALHFFSAVSYTHLTLPTICSV